MKKILMYSHDTYGLGNIRRTLEIANQLIKTRDDVTILIVSGSPMLHAFRISKGIDYIKLPCLDRSEADGYRVKTLGVAFKDLMRLRANLILNSVLDFNPDVILVDKKPLGVDRELAPMLEMMSLRGLKPRLALILRDILDSPSQTTKVWRQQRYDEAIDAFYDQILVLGSQKIFDLPAEYLFPSHITKKVHFCGYLEREPGKRSREVVRQQMHIGNRPLVLVTAGGGNDGGELLTTYLNGLRTQRNMLDFHSLLLCGPEMSTTTRAELESIAHDLPSCDIGEFSNDLMSDIAAADVVVSMGGYNTICEILSMRKPAIVAPRNKPVQEQLIRAQKML